MQCMTLCNRVNMPDADGETAHAGWNSQVAMPLHDPTVATKFRTGRAANMPGTDRSEMAGAQPFATV